MEIKDTLPTLRTIRGLSQLQLAQLVGIDRSYITAIETGRTLMPSHRVVKRLAKALGVSMTVLDGEEPIPGLEDRPATVADLRKAASQAETRQSARRMEALALRMDQDLNSYLAYLGKLWELEESGPESSPREDHPGD